MKVTRADVTERELREFLQRTSYTDDTEKRTQARALFVWLTEPAEAFEAPAEAAPAAVVVAELPDNVSGNAKPQRGRKK